MFNLFRLRLSASSIPRKRIRHDAIFIDDELIVVGDPTAQKADAVAEKCSINYNYFMICRNFTYTAVSQGVISSAIIELFFYYKL